MKLFNRISLFAVVFSLLLLVSPYPAAAGQVVATATPIAVQYNIGESVSVSASGSITMAGSGNSNIVTLTINYNLIPSNHASQDLYGYTYFTSSTAALSAGSGQNVPASNLVATVTGSGANAYMNCNTQGSNGSGPFHTILGSDFLCSSVDIPYATWSGAPSGSNTSTIALAFATGTAPTGAGNYSGTLNFIAGLN